ncbi:MAG: Diguanylate cyclase and metal dependent phosphohydrolase [Thermoanaerobacterales bacterium 50_218]|nr:MAG: Diguanylate cyclase and metal dependent phosphohydrolase [Thermoanaerobacterales bacterium 50_218]
MSETLELAILYEISALSFPESERDLYWELVEKCSRIFGIRRVVFLLNFGDREVCYRWGFDYRKQVNCREFIAKNASSPNVLVKEITRKGESVGFLYLEKGRKITRSESRLLEIFCSRLEDILNAYYWEQEYRRTNECFRLLLEKTPMVAVFSFDRNGKIISWNKEAQRIFGFTDELKKTWKLEDLLPRTTPSEEFRKQIAQTWKTGQATPPRELRFVSCCGEENWILYTLVPVPKTSPHRKVFCMGVDITTRKQVEQELYQLSSHDTVTGLFNRNYFEQEMRRLDEVKLRPVSIVVCDVDELKLVNDIAGHYEGDELLRQVAHVLKSSFRSGDVVARVGGDEFAVILPGVDGHTAQGICKRLYEQIEKYNRESPRPHLSVSIGFATVFEPETSVYEAYKEADYMMYQNKLQQSEKIRKKIIQSLVSMSREKAFAKRQLERLRKLAAELQLPGTV